MSLVFAFSVSDWGGTVFCVGACHGLVGFKLAKQLHAEAVDVSQSGRCAAVSSGGLERRKKDLQRNGYPSDRPCIRAMPQYTLRVHEKRRLARTAHDRTLG